MDVQQLRQLYHALLPDDIIATDYERWRELKRLVIVHGLPQDEGFELDVEGARTSRNSLRGRVWKAFLGVENDVDMTKYSALVGKGASHYDGEIRNDTFRTFRGDSEFAQRVPEEKLVRLLNVFINELGSTPLGETNEEEGELARCGNLPSIRYVQGMNVLCAPLLYVLPEPEAYHMFCQLIVRHCPHYMAPQLKGVEKGCALVDKCLQTLDPELYRHLTSRGICAQIYALPLILSLFACVPPLHELLRVWDVLFAVGVHFVVVLAVAHTVLLREHLLKLDMDLMKVLSLRCVPPLQSDLLISVALQLLHRLPEDLLYEIARHPFANPDAPTSLPFHPKTISAIAKQVQNRQQSQTRDF
ncbi:hypothetical protein CCR75_004763 [Bremia lactucae]|uniref:Rab-GAP TBC domain-containing protein n=1 Tax=Bremia lactucae TaxID=4779 RepID=A0A976FKJ4_BRELC|nr:hypothetical protein CCR75_004763 [Bremia lactucae]